MAEFDKTGQLKRIKVKERVNFTIDHELMRLFRSYCQKYGLKMSNVLEILIKKELEQKSKKRP